MCNKAVTKVVVDSTNSYKNISHVFVDKKPGSLQGIISPVLQVVQQIPANSGKQHQQHMITPNEPIKLQISKANERISADLCSPTLTAESKLDLCTSLRTACKNILKVKKHSTAC